MLGLSEAGAGGECFGTNVGRRRGFQLMAVAVVSL